MNEIVLSNDLNVITAEINSYKQVAGQAIFEIGKRLKHVKENDLVHGEFGKWLESMDIDRSFATRSMKVATELSDSNYATWNKLSSRALYEIATMPEQEREQHHTIPSTGETKTVDEMTVKELQEVKKQLKQEQQARQQAEQDNQKLGQLLAEERNKEQEVKVIEKEIIPDHIKDKIQKQERMMKAAKREHEQLQDELRILKAQQSSDIEDDLADHKIKRLEREADIETLELSINIKRFLKEASLTQYQVGALASASESKKKNIQESVEMLEQFTKNIKTALNGRIEI